MSAITSYPTSYETTGTIKGTKYQSAVGKSSSTSTTGNDYASSSGSTATITYSFDFSSIPNEVEIQSVVVNVGGHCENTSKSTATLQLYSGDTPKGSESSFTSTSHQVITMDVGEWTTEELKNAKLSFTIGYYGGLIGGVDFIVNYITSPKTVTVRTGSNISIDKNSETVLDSGEPYTITIFTTNNVTSMTDNEVDVKESLTEIDPSSISHPVSYTTSTSTNGTNYTKAIGNGSDIETSGNDYSSSSNSYATITYSFDFSDISEDATITSVVVKVGGHCENVDKSTAKLQLYSGDTLKGSESSFTSKSHQIITMDAGEWTRAELQNAKLAFTIGYYGGLVAGVDFIVEYALPSNAKRYRYTIQSVTEDHLILINIDDTGDETGTKLSIKINGNWVGVAHIYRKENGVFIEKTANDLPEGNIIWAT